MSSSPEKRSALDERLEKLSVAFANAGALSVASAGLVLEYMGITETENALRGWEEIAAGTAMFGVAYLTHKFPQIHASAQRRLNEFTDRHFEA